MKNLHKISPQTPIWLGGPEVSFDIKDTFAAFQGVKGIIIGEGEETFSNVLEAYCNANGADSILKKINGIAFRSGNDVVETPKKAPVEFDTLPFVYENLEEFENRIIYYESSRGCPFRCSYCLSSVDKCLRFRSLDKIKSELSYFLKNHVRQVKFVDRTFNVNHDHSMEIWRFIKENDNGKTNFHFEIAGDLLTDDELRLLKGLRPGQVQLEIGVQTTNEKTLEEINRPMDFKRLNDVVSKIKTNGNVHLHLDLIAGLPYEDIDSFKKSFNDVIDLKPHQLQLGFLKVLKGSPMADRAEQYHLKYSAQPPYEVLSTQWISYDDLIRLKRVEEMVDMYYNSGKFCRSLEILMAVFESPFELFDELARWHKEQGADLINLSRNRKYQLLLGFGEKHIITGANETSRDKPVFTKNDFMDALIYDFYAGENAKTRPDFFRKEGIDKAFAKEFYSSEAREHRYLSHGEIGKTDDPRILRKHTHLEKTTEGYLLFDYTRIDPITGNADIIKAP